MVFLLLFGVLSTIVYNSRYQPKGNITMQCENELTMGERLGIAINATGWTQSKLARKIAGSDATPEKINSEKSKINALIRRKSKFSPLSASYAEILQISRDWLESGLGEMTTTIVANNQSSEKNKSENKETIVDNAVSFGLSPLKGYLRMTDPHRQLIGIDKIMIPLQQVAVIGCTKTTETYQVKGSDFVPVLQNGWLISVDPSRQPAAGEWLLIERADSYALILFSFERADCVTGQDVLTDKTVSIDKADIKSLNPVLSISMPSQLLPIGD